MLTTLERRVLYLLRKYGGSTKHSQISQAMSRVSAGDRMQALASLEQLDLISSAKTPPPKGQGKGGTGGLVYWLTSEGGVYVQGLIESGEMQDPAKESRGKPKRSIACG